LWHWGTKKQRLDLILHQKATGLAPKNRARLSPIQCSTFTWSQVLLQNGCSSSENWIWLGCSWWQHPHGASCGWRASHRLQIENPRRSRLCRALQVPADNRTYWLNWQEWVKSWAWVWKIILIRFTLQD
jgi:hypothetical protein